MLSRNLYRNKKSPLNNQRKKFLLATIFSICIFLIIYGIYNFGKISKTASQKQEIKVATGDQPLKQNLVAYINADKGLSLRKERDSNSERLTIIPDKTKLDVTEELDGWYKVAYDGKEGWISKQYATLDAPATDPTAGWGLFSSPLAFTIKYPTGWKMQDYGADPNTKTLAFAGFGNQTLPTTVPAGTEFVAPVTVKLTSMTQDEAKKVYSAIGGVTSQAITFGTYPATQFTYTSGSTATQVNAVVLESGGKVFIFAEAGGYLEDLLNMSKTFTIGG